MYLQYIVGFRNVLTVQKFSLFVILTISWSWLGPHILVDRVAKCWACCALWMTSSRVVWASDSQCRSSNCPGFDPSILRHSGIWGAADEAVSLNPPSPFTCCAYGKWLVMLLGWFNLRGGAWWLKFTSAIRNVIRFLYVNFWIWPYSWNRHLHYFTVDALLLHCP